VLVSKTGRPDIRQLRSLSKGLVSLQRAGYQVVVVTSGAIGAGMEALGIKQRPTRLPDLQMAAAVGQARLMAQYAELLGKLNCIVGQVLLTHADFQHKIRFTNARRTMEHLLSNNVIPIINENDVVADEEIKADLALGDNDLLASLVVKMIRADLLILLSTVNGVLEPVSGKFRRIPYIETISSHTFALVRKGKSNLSKGGMKSKLRAAQSASQAGCTTVIANGREAGVLSSILQGKDTGTMILPCATF
jgi:glutamate 5-kinase